MASMYRRQCEVLIGSYQFRYGEIAMRISVEFDDDKEPNESTIELYNLSKHTLANLKTGMKVIVNAGYGNDLGTVLQGKIVEVRTQREQMDRVTTLQVKDVVNSSKVTLQQSYRPGTKASEIIRDLLSRAKISHGPIQLDQDYTYTQGFTVKGDALEAVQRAAKACGTSTYTKQGQLRFRSKHHSASMTLELSPASGLIESPESFEEEKVKGVRVKSLLHYRLYAGAKLRLVSEDFEGDYKVKKGRHTLSDDEFTTEVDLVKG
ncbi:phage protein [Paenibacillus aquistagni]|uniref:phage protein n=1 Tax=Paenibacillus aquistagni TaxID=1852522 RepID=UPI00145BD4C9|nr:hypothetical protein [Paenibacillus aquistagni]NMM53531.1 hypothetical protein [Paenibacillus aquistagni]